MRLALLTVDVPNQAALARKLTAVCELAGVALSANASTVPSLRRVRRFLNRVEGRLAGRPFVRSWHAMQRRFAEQAGGWPEAPVLRVQNINDPRTVAWLTSLRPDVVLVSGTNLVGPAILAWGASCRGMINLHTGLSPYVKGGPDCTNWCLAEGVFHLIGNTVLWLDAGIDSGPILATELTPLTGRESLPDLHWAVMTHAHDLCVRSIQALGEGRPVARIPQDTIAAGRLLVSADWNARAMRRALQNFHSQFTPARLSSEPFLRQRAAVTTIQLPAPAAAQPRGHA